MKTYTINEFLTAHKKDNFKFIRLESETGEVIIHYNNNKRSVKDRIAEITEFINADSTPDGIYNVKVKNSVHTKPHLNFTVVKGDVKPKENLSEEPRPNNPGMSEHVLSFQQALDLQVENAKLKMQLEAKEKECNDLIDELEELENESPEEPLGEPDPVESFMKNLLPQFIPIADRYFDIKERHLRLQEKQLYLQNAKNGQRRRPSAIPIDNGQENHHFDPNNPPEISDPPTLEEQEIYRQWLTAYAQADPEGYTEFINEQNEQVQ